MKNQEEFQPKGTVAILVVFVITLIVLWGTIYLTLLQRGGTV
ncbi:MAG: cytochrome c oxidase subunit 2A [Chloroflexi bacterium]|jgi:hypothetical protein|nr:cytochrome c oxidase subunit 2A [Chloroflexota bacterium]